MCDIQYEELDNKEMLYQDLQCITKEINSENSVEVKAPEISIEKESFEMISMSEIYSCYSASWENKIKPRPILVDSSIMSSDIDETENDDNDHNHIKQSYINIATSSEIMDQKKDLISQKKSFADTGSMSLIDESLCDGKTKDDRSLKSKSWNNSNINSSHNENGGDKKHLLKKVLVDSCCDSTGETTVIHRKTINKIPVSKNVAVASFSCNFVDNDQVKVKDCEMKTTSTETEKCEDTKEESSFSTQANDIYNSLEEKILPFIKSPNTVELKLKGRLSVFQHACIKQIATQHNLMIKSFGKGHDSFILLRKKIELLKSQKQFLEMKKNELKRKKEQAAELKAKQERILNPPKTISSGCQVDFMSEENEKERISKKAAKRNRKKQWELKQKQMLKRNSGTQTIENGFYVCPYCEDDIPESLQFIHYPHCLEKYRSIMQSKSRSSTRTSSATNFYSQNIHKKHRSKSRDKVNHSKIDNLKKELEKVHDNDINGIVNLVAELDKKCSVSGCNKKKNKTCAYCSSDFCDSHYSPEGQSSEQHFNCTVLLEKLELDNKRKLGANNPLLKTVEQLTTPHFADGSMIKRKKRVQMISNKTEDANGNDHAQIKSHIPVPDVNQTRTRNGPMLSFERNNLKKELKEKISLLVDKRCK